MKYSSTLAASGRRRDLDRIAVTTTTSVAEVERAQWDSLVHETNFYQSYRWLLSLDIAQGATPVVVARRVHDHKLVGGMPIWHGPGSGCDDLFRLPTFFPDVPGPWCHDFLWIGSRRSVLNDIVCTRGESRRVTLATLMRHAYRIAAESRAAGVVAPYLPLATARELAAAQPGAHIMVHDADATIAVPPGGFEELMALASRSDRHTWRRELRAFFEDGNTVTWTAVTDDVIEIAAVLIANTRARYGNHTGPDTLRRAFAAQRASGALDQAVAALCLRNDRPIGISIFYRHGQQLYGRYTGFDYAHLTPTFQYFVLCYYEAVRWAAINNVNRLRVAVSAPEAKVKRAAKLSPLVAVVLPLNGHQLDEHAIRDHNVNCVKRWQDKFGQHGNSLTADWQQLSNQPIS